MKKKRILIIKVAKHTTKGWKTLITNKLSKTIKLSEEKSQQIEISFQIFILNLNTRNRSVSTVGNPYYIV